MKLLYRFFRIISGMEAREARTRYEKATQEFIESQKELIEVLEEQVQIYRDLRRLEVGK